MTRGSVPCGTRLELFFSRGCQEGDSARSHRGHCQGQVMQVLSPTSSTARGEGTPLHVPMQRRDTFATSLCRCHPGHAIMGWRDSCALPALPHRFPPRALSIPLDPAGLHAAPLPSAAGMCRVPRVAPLPWVLLSRGGPGCPHTPSQSRRCQPGAAGLPHRLLPEPGCPRLLLGLSQRLGGTEASERCT